MWPRPRMGMNYGRGGMRPQGYPHRPPFYNQRGAPPRPLMSLPMNRPPPRHQYQPRPQQRMTPPPKPVVNKKTDTSKETVKPMEVEVDEELMPSDEEEAQKISALQMQAAHWKSTKEHMEQQQEMHEKMQFAKSVTPAQLDAVLQEEQDFEKQYSDWRKQFEEWQEQNKNHPNKEQYQQYAKQWNEYEIQMEEKKTGIKTRKEKLQEAIKLKNQMMSSTPPPYGIMRPMGPRMGPRMGSPMMRPMGPRPMMGPHGFRPMGPGPMVPRAPAPRVGYMGANSSSAVGGSMMAGQTESSAAAVEEEEEEEVLEGDGGEEEFEDDSTNQADKVESLAPPGTDIAPPGTEVVELDKTKKKTLDEAMNIDTEKEAAEEPEIDLSKRSGRVSTMSFLTGDSTPKTQPTKPNVKPPTTFSRSSRHPTMSLLAAHLEDERRKEEEERDKRKAKEEDERNKRKAKKEDEQARLKEKEEAEEKARQLREEEEERELQREQEEATRKVWQEKLLSGELELEEEAVEEADGLNLDGSTVMTPDMAEKLKQEELRRIDETGAQNLSDIERKQMLLDEKLTKSMGSRDQRAAFHRAAATMRMIQEQQERIEQIKKIQELTKAHEEQQKQAEDRMVLEQELEKERIEKRRVEIEKKLAERKSSQMQQQIEKALDKASGKVVEDKDKDKDKKITIKLDKKKDDDGRKSPTRKRSRSPYHRKKSKSPYRDPRRSRSPYRRRRSRSRSRSRGRRSRSRSPYKRRSRSPHRRSRSRSRGRRSRSREKRDVFGRSVDLYSKQRAKDDEVKSREREREQEKTRERERERERDREQRERERDKERERERRRTSPARSESRPRMDTGEGRSESVSSNNRPSGARTSLVPYDDDGEEERARDSYARDPYRRDPYRDDPLLRRDDPRLAPRRVDDHVRHDPYDATSRDIYLRDARYAREPYDPYRRDPYAERPLADPYRDRAEGYRRDMYYRDFFRDQVPLYDRNPIDDSIRRLVYSCQPTIEIYPELRYNRCLLLFGDDEDDQAVFDYEHGKSKVPDDPYSDPDANKKEELYSADKQITGPPPPSDYSYKPPTGYERIRRESLESFDTASNSPAEYQSTRYDPSGHDVARSETTRSDTTKFDQSQRDSKPDTSRYDSRSESTRYDSRSESTRYDSPRHDLRSDATKLESRSESSRSRTDSSRYDSARHDSRSYDQLSRTRRYDESSNSPIPRELMRQPPPPPPVEEKSEHISIEDLLMSPGRERRPLKLVIIVRGLPGSGKTFISKLIRERETSNGGAPPRMLCLDDYFMVETEKMIKDSESGRMLMQKVMEYEYEGFMENSYRVSMLKSFKKTIDDGYFPFIIVDAVNHKIKQFEEFWSYANSKGFQVYVAELETDANTSAKRNVHHRTGKEIQEILKEWEDLPPMFARVDVRPLLQDAAITDVEMMDQEDEPEEEEELADEDEEEDDDGGYQKSKWELDTSERKLDKLDGLSKRQKHMSETEKFEEYLQLPDDYDMRQNSQEPGRKRVRWADIEERKDQQRQRNLGFVVGHTNWDKMLDDNYADRALNRTKYF